MNPPAGDDTLAADAAAAGETARLGHGGLPRYAPQPRPAPAPGAAPYAARDQGSDEGDPIGEITRPGPAPDTSVQPDAPAHHEARAEHLVRPHRVTLLPQPPPGAQAALQAHHRLAHHHVRHERPAVDLGREVQAAAPPEAPIAAPAPSPSPARVRIRPHRLHIVVEPPRRPTLEAPSETAPVNPALPQVDATPPAPAPLDVKAALAQMARSAAADMRAARFELSSALSRGRDGAAVVTLPAGLLAQLQQDAEDAGLAPEGPISVTVTLSGQGYGIVPEGAQTSRAQPGHPATFTWGVDPTGASGGMLTASMTAVLPIDGESRSVPLGVLTADIPPPPVIAAPPAAATAPAPAAAPATTAAPAVDLGSRVRADLGKLGVADPSRFNLRDLAIPGYPTLDVPLLGEVPSEKVVAAGLILLAFLFVQSLLRGAGARAERRRRLAEIEDAYFSQGRL